MPRFILHLATACLVYMTLVLPASAMPLIWVALSDESLSYLEAAAVLRDTLGDRATVKSGRWQTLRAEQTPPPDLLVTIGVEALDGMLERLAGEVAVWPQVPILAIMVPQVIFEARQATPGLGARALSAVVLDQPPERQLALIKRALPGRTRVGILPGSLTNPKLGALRKEAARQQLKLVVGPAVEEPKHISLSLKAVLEESDVILALPDPAVYYGSSLQYILLTTYRARVPLAAYSQAFVKSGAVLGLYSTPTQMALRATEMIHAWQGGRVLQPVQFPRGFIVETNPKVAASLGLSIDDASSITEDLRRLEHSR
jgi:hypothetical protein